MNESWVFISGFERLIQNNFGSTTDQSTLSVSGIIQSPAFHRVEFQFCTSLNYPNKGEYFGIRMTTAVTAFYVVTRMNKFNMRQSVLHNNVQRGQSFTIPCVQFAPNLQ